MYIVDNGRASGLGSANMLSHGKGARPLHQRLVGYSVFKGNTKTIDRGRLGGSSRCSSSRLGPKGQQRSSSGSLGSTLASKTRASNTNPT